MRTALRLWVLVAFAALTSSSALAQPGYTGDPGGYTQRQGIPYVTHDASCTGKGTALSPLSCGTGGGTGSFSSFTDTGPFFLTGTIGPAAITGTVNNWNPCDSVSVSICLANTNGVRVALSGAASLSGLVAQSSGFQIELRNTSSSLALTLLNQNAGSSAANRFLLPNSASWVVPPQGSIILRYSVSAGAWAPASSNNNNLMGTALAVTGTSTLADVTATSINDSGALAAGASTLGATTVTTLGASGTSTLAGVSATSIADSGFLTLTGAVTPAALSGSVNDYAPAGLSNATLLRQDASAPSTLTGLAAGASGQVFTFINLSTVNSITLTNEDILSAAANRFTLPNNASWVIPPGGAVLLRYSPTTSRWRPEHSNNNNLMATALAVSGPETETGVINPTGLTGTLNDWAPTGFATTKYVYLTLSGSTTITGIAGGADGRVITLIADPANAANVTFNHENAGSVAANRIQLIGGVNWTLNSATTTVLTLRYNLAAQRWQQISGTSGTINYAIAFNSVVNFGSVISPAQLASGNTIDYAPGSGTVYRITPASGGSTLVSLSSGASQVGRTVFFRNISAADNLTIQNDDGATGTATMRFSIDNAANCVLTPGTSMMFQYDTVTSRWRSMSPCPNSTQNFWAGVQNDSTTGTLNDYALGASATVIKLTNATQTTLTGIAGGTDGRIVVVERNGSSVVLSSENASSAAANRISGLNGTSSSLSGLNASAFLMYDSTTQRWHEIAVVSTTMPSPIVNGILLGTTASSAALIGNAAASATVPTLIPNQSDTTTGVGADVSGDVSIVIGGVEKFRFGSFATSFGSLTASAANSWKFPNSTASATVPTLVPNSNDATTGVGAQASGNVSLIAAGTEILRATSTGMLAGSAGNKGTIVLSAGTGTHSSIPGTVCVCSDTTAVAAVKCALSAGTLTATGTGTDTVAYICL